MSEERSRMHDRVESHRRFTVAQRIEHAILALSFTILSVTGLVQKYAASPVSQALIQWMGGILSTRIIHRWAAAVFSALTVYHAIVLAHKYIVRRVELTMVPGLKDLADAWNLIRYNLSLAEKPPQMPRYNFTEKLEYWALIWGGVIMMVTGFMLWNPLITTGILPGQVISAAKAAHGGEAVLAVLAIVVWHFYNVHLKAFNKSMFTGKLSRHEMEEEHGGEWSRLMAGEAPPLVASKAPKRRTILFFPLAIAIAGSGAGFIYWAATAETTAIQTVPPMPRAEIAAPVPPSPAAVPAIVSAPRIPHPIAGQRQCYQCHARGGLKPVPADHQGRPVESCLICHTPAPVPVSEPKAKETAAVQPAGGQPGKIPHSIETQIYKDCTKCHGPGKLKPNPESHAPFTVDMCTACHQPSSAPKE